MQDTAKTRRVPYMPITIAALIAILVLAMYAPAASAQGAGPGPEPPCNGTPFERYLPEVNGCVTTEGVPFPGEAIVYHADTREPIGKLKDFQGERPETSTPDTTEPEPIKKPVDEEQYKEEPKKEEQVCPPGTAPVPKTNGCVAVEGLTPEQEHGDSLVFDPNTGETLGPLKNFVENPNALSTPQPEATESETPSVVGPAPEEQVADEDAAPVGEASEGDGLLELPATGGATLLLPIGALIAAAGLVFALVRRR